MFLPFPSPDLDVRVVGDDHQLMAYSLREELFWSIHLDVDWSGDCLVMEDDL